MAYTEFLNKHKKAGTNVKVFIDNSKNTMLQGTIKDFDDDCIILDNCLIMTQNIVSITP